MKGETQYVRTLNFLKDLKLMYQTGVETLESNIYIEQINMVSRLKSKRIILASEDSTHTYSRKSVPSTFFCFFFFFFFLTSTF
jgi:hypothetical protein